MEQTLGLELPEVTADTDNITDWALTQFQTRYGEHITKDDIWEYLYGVMHAPDWRERYRHDLQRNLPRIPLADDFEAFRSAGRKLIDLHIGFETVEEWPVECEVEAMIDEGGLDASAYRIKTKMRWGKKKSGEEDRTVLLINDRCRLVGIPAEAENYTVSGRSPLQWAIDSLRIKHDKSSKIIDDINQWHQWAEEPFNLIRHLRRLVTVSVESSRIINNLPPALPSSAG
ncbi:type ISP restriction/modification enzyme [Candidatus Poriferisocius sp.]|uniref:type ISP restriction/modification enzyme n=1 Tax=Candidatus Poriferisocius sp. TaxID=3101276 RepID=UPI003B010255